MYKELIRKKEKLEEELRIIIQQKCDLHEELESIHKAIKEKEKELEDKAKEINSILNDMENEKLCIKQQKEKKAETERKETAKKIEDLTDVLSSKSFYKSIRKYLPKPHWKKLTKAIQSEELFAFILKKHYANRVIMAYKNENEIELNNQIMEAIVNKLKTLIK